MCFFSVGNLVGKEFCATLLRLYLILQNSEENPERKLNRSRIFYFPEGIIESLENFWFSRVSRDNNSGKRLTRVSPRFRNSIPAVLTSDGNLPFPFPWSDPTAFSSSIRQNCFVSTCLRSLYATTSTFYPCVNSIQNIFWWSRLKLWMQLWSE